MIDGMAFTWASPERRLSAGDLVKVVDAYSRGELTGRDGKPLGNGGPPAAVAVSRAVLDPSRAPQGFERKYRDLHKALAPEMEALRAGGIKVVAGPGGLLGFEVWLYPATEDGPKPSVGFGTPPTNRDSEAKRGHVKGAKIRQGVEGMVEASRPERRTATLPMDRVLELAGEGLGARRIAEVLRAEGREVSWRSIARRLAQAQQGRLLP